jgi:hypothetical protein
MVQELRALLFFACILGLSSGADAQEPRGGGAPPEKLLSVHMEIIDQSYCQVDDQIFGVLMDLRLRFINVSSVPVILSRRIGSKTIVDVAPDVKAGKNMNFLYSNYVSSERDRLGDDAHLAPSFNDTPDSTLFVILAPSESFETVIFPGLLRSKGEVNGLIEGRLSKGSYVLQVDVSTWPYVGLHSEEERLAERWAKFGKLATGSVRSDFASFTIPEHFKKNRHCQERPPSF